MSGSSLRLIAFLAFVPACSAAGSSGADESAPVAVQAANEVERWGVEIVDTRPHDTEAYTQGLLWRDGVVYESTGRYGSSSLRAWRWPEGTEIDRQELDRSLFGEGIALVPGPDGEGERLVQLTWRRGQAIVWSLEPFRELGRARYRGEGWGLTFDGSHLIMSDGTPSLVFRDPYTFEVERRLRVTRRGMPVDDLNELELVDKLLFANLFESDEIAVIDVDSGAVVAVVDASGLLTVAEAEAADVLNGIAYRPDAGTFLLTGKNWPWVFEVRFVGYDPSAPSSRRAVGDKDDEETE